MNSNTNHTQNSQPSAQQSSNTFYHLEQQTQQRQALGALAAASLSSILNPSAHSTINQNRTIVPYDDLAQTNVEKSTEPINRQCCNRWYKTEHALTQHTKQHIRCEECGTFEATPNIVRDHKENVHGIIQPGKKPKKPDGVVPPNAPILDTPEKIQAWIEARKKNWPSKANVERKEKEDEERIARGELPRHGNKRKQKNTYVDNNKNNNNKRQKMNQNNISEEDKETTPSNSITGLVNYASDSDDGFNAEEDESVNKANSKNQNEENNDNGAVDDDDNDSDLMDLDADAISSKDPSSIGKITLSSDENSQSQKPKKLCKYFMRGKCVHGDQCRYSHEKPKKTQQQQQNKPKPVESFRKRPHLLRMLLSKEIRQEHNIILQCFRYLKEQKFFDSIDNNGDDDHHVDS
ncbi:unnamed protein product [Cunninghamella blakesleeana]